MIGLALAQEPGPVFLVGSGGTAQQVNVPQIGTGGAISTQGAYTVHVFTSNGTFTPPAGLAQLDVLVVAGGGGGGGNQNGAGGGGAGGLVWTQNLSVNQGSYSVVVGAGGIGGSSTNSTDGQQGNNSSFGSVTAIGGGGGQRGNSSNTSAGGSGGSGGGGGSNNAGDGGAGTPGQGNDGADGTNGNNNNDRGGGGGGAGGAGTTGAGGNGGSGGAGGAGQDFSAIFGTGVGQAGWFAGGGGGGKRQNGSGGAGGQGGGGSGSATGAGSAGQANTGGGGGGSGGTGGTAGGNGGSGIIIVRYVAPELTYVIHTFTTSGGFTPPPGVSAVDALIVGGGGGGGGYRYGGGGGGAGGLRWLQNQAITQTSYAVTVGAGGAGGTTASDASGNGQNGGASSFGALVALGGGGGQRGDQGADGGFAGASGGGGGSTSVNGSARPGGAGTAGQGNAGGAGNSSSGFTSRSGGGGGGAGAAGGNGIGTTSGGAGGAGQDFSAIFGTGAGEAGWFAGGGGGGKAAGGSGGAGGQGGGGDGTTGTGAAATANTGGGGGGSGGFGNAGGTGASGIVILRYLPSTLEIVQQPSANALLGVAFAQQPVIELLDGSGAPVSGVTVTASLASGDGLLGGTLSAVTNASGQAVFSNLLFINGGGAQTLRFTASGSTVALESNAVTLPPPPDHFRISYPVTGDACTPSTVQILAADAGGNALTAYTGTIEISASTGVGGWTLAAGSGTFVAGPNDGTATYTFSDLDDGIVQLSYLSNNVGIVDFDVQAGAVTEGGAFDPALDIQACDPNGPASQFAIAHSFTGALCTANLVTISAINNAGEVDPDYLGTVTLSNSQNSGSWVLVDGDGGLSNQTGGQATYTFVASDAGMAQFAFNPAVTGVYDFDVSDGSLSESAFHDGELTITDCAFRISHDGSADVCTAEAVTITVVDSGGNTITAYAGTMNLSTSTGTGDWEASPTAQGNLINQGAGSASYAFDPGDAGEVVLLLTHGATAANVDIDLTDGSIHDDEDSEPGLEVLPCSFSVGFSSFSTTSCAPVTVSLQVTNSLGMPATGYEGMVTLGTDTGHGTWVSTTGNGSLVDNSPGNGTGSYTFVEADAGSVDIVFSNTESEDLHITASADGGAITVGEDDDPLLEVTPCLPVVGQVACYQSVSQAGALTLSSAAATGGSRMVLMFTNSESTTDVTGASIAGAPMTLLRQEKNLNGTGNTLDVWGILDAGLPAGGGPVDAAFAGGANTPGMCLVALEYVKQVFPEYNESAPNSGQLNSSSGAATQVASTTITPNESNSLVIDAVSTGADGTTYTSSLSQSLWDSSGPNPGSVEFYGNYERVPVPKAMVIEETNSAASPNRHTHLALSVAPFVPGPPAVDGYVPVSLFHTFSGNVNYRAIGNSLRLFDNFETNPANAACVMQPLATGSTATLDIPSGSTVLDAYLYWAGSGYEEDVDDLVHFGEDGQPGDDITADEVFIIEPNQVYNPDFEAVPEGFFAAVKNVAGLISNVPGTVYRLSGLDVRTDGDWATFSTCVGGWALVVVYENPMESLNVINLFHGFQPFWHSFFTLVPRNFRMATPDGVSLPHGQLTHITFEGDPDITADTAPAGEEVFQLQDDPNAQTFDSRTDPLNPLNNQYNDTVSRPVYDAGTFDFTGYTGVTTSYGTDIDTYYVEGDTSGELLYPFGSEEAEQITTRYATGQDIVLLVGEFISVSNAPIADLEVFVGDSGGFKVGSSGTAGYQYRVVNNGNGAVTGGFANGEVILTGNMPAGITIAAISAPGWDCGLQSATAFTCFFDIAADWSLALGAATAGELAAGESLPLVEVDVNVGVETAFPLLDNDVTTIARLSHSGGNCPVEPAGVQPDPTLCDRAPQFDNVNDLNKHLIDIDNLIEKQANNNNVHSDTTNVRGIETNLGIAKSLVGVLEANEAGQYQLAVTNFGPDSTTKPLTVSDTLPNGLAPQSATGTGWSCNIAGQAVSCTRASSLGVGGFSTITITTGNVVAPALQGSNVSNTAQVAAGQYNFDTNLANNASTVISTVVGPVAESEERFLISVSETASIGGLGPFEPGDLVVYDPVTDVAEMFLDVSTLTDTSLADIDAVHLLPNGQIILSAATSSTLAGLAFEPEDLVLYDPLLHQATLLLDGSAVFTGPADIDGVHVFHHDSYVTTDWDVVISTKDAASIGALSFQDNDLVSYPLSGGPAVLLVDGGGGDMFDGAGGDIDAVHIRAADEDVYVFSTDDAMTTVGISGEQLSYGRDDLVEVDLGTPGDPATDPLFRGDETPGIFTPASATRRLDAVHVIEDGYFGHFALLATPGTTCSATTITLRKHAGLSHVTETYYRGSVIVDTGLGEGTWAKDASANGVITALGDGRARYTFAAGDNGQVILYLTETEAGILNVQVDNGFVTENSPTEDPDITVTEFSQPISYADEFAVAQYGVNDGIASFADDWTEANDDGSAAGGKIQITGGRLRFNNLGGGQPSLARSIDFSGYTVNDPPVLSFDWSRGNVAPSDSFVVEARGSSADAWTVLQNFTGATGAGSGSAQYTLTAMPHNLVLSATTQIRFRVASGFSAASNLYFFVDNVQVSTDTNDCGAGDAIDHYAVSHAGTMISCLAELVTVSAHTLGELATEPGAGVTITLNTTTGKGTWNPPVNGNGSFSAVPGTGQASYTFLLGESSVSFPFNYTALAGDSEVVGFTVSDTNIPAKGQLEAPLLTVSRAGLRFFNDTLSSTVYPTLVAGMPSDLYTGQVLTVQAVRTSDQNPQMCEPVFPDGGNAVIELAFECHDPLTCSAAAVPMDVTNNGATTSVEPVSDDLGPGVNAGGFVPVTLQFQAFTGGDFGDGSYVGAPLVLNYGDAGLIQIHGRYDIPLNSDPAGGSGFSGDYLEGSSDAFVVRPFAYDIDFSEDRAGNGHDADAASWAEDAAGSAFFTAGAGFSTTVTAVAWQLEDDAGWLNDMVANGLPFAGAELFDNPATPNYGKETDPLENDTTVSFSRVAPAAGVDGILLNGTFSGFAADGGETHSLTYTEVGIIDLEAVLDSGDYLDSGQGIEGAVTNVGRFIPADFAVSGTSLVPRPLFIPSASPFTYMGEEFQANFTLTARNALGQVTENYEGAFAKLDDPAELDFFAVDDFGPGLDDINYSARLSVSAANGFAADLAPLWADGVLSLGGNLVFARQPGGAEEAPIETLRVALTAVDDDAVSDTGRNVDDDDGTAEDTAFLYNLIGEHEFRYGRLRLENAYGSEIPELDSLGDPTGRDLEVRVVAEYWDGSRFVVNGDDVATPYSSSALDFVPDSYTDNLAPGDAAIMPGVQGIIWHGLTEEGNATDLPLLLQAPGETHDGSALVELDLEALGLEFLQFNWRTPPALQDATEPGDSDYTENPRALIEFGKFRGNDRIINWQEIFE